MADLSKSQCFETEMSRYTLGRIERLDGSVSWIIHQMIPDTHRCIVLYSGDNDETVSIYWDRICQKQYVNSKAEPDVHTEFDQEVDDRRVQVKRKVSPNADHILVLRTGPEGSVSTMLYKSLDSAMEAAANIVSGLRSEKLSRTHYVQDQRFGAF